ncbi:S9 family peptidase [Kordiimonas sp. SCSIO 12610]|uniref:alpha/beta hydrolase family protein n=1 Tax=Kordiimonas sp. SCSIO 12610 TaxID=2829597 RepID=UPI002108762B|nr:prolyl oligopeptidase family serine peptidase [Kordiimonas sp. SCSIO 12610]UTW54746.1 S9 family peptidase [Kordiimonas sp. SCSIO 12610]
MRIVLSIFLLLFLCQTNLSAKTVIEKKSLELIPVENFAARPEISAPRLNPEGSRLLISRHDAGVNTIEIGAIDVDGYAVSHRISVPDNVYRHRVFWADNDRVIVQYTSYSGSLPLIDEKPSIEIFAVDYNGQNQLKLFDIPAEQPSEKQNKKRRKRTKKKSERVYFRIIHLLPKEADFVLLERVIETPKKGNDDEEDIVTDIFRLNIRTAAREEITPKHDIEGAQMYTWLADYDGNIRLGYGEDAEEKAIMLVRRSPESQWKRLDDNELFEKGKFDPMFFGKADDELYVSSSYATGRTAIYQFDMKRGRLKKPIFNDPKKDAAFLYYSFVGGKVLGVAHNDQVFERTIYDPAFGSMIDTIHEVTGDVGEIYMGSQSLDEQRSIVFVEDNRSPGTIWFYDNVEQRGFEIGPINSAIDSERMSSMQPVVYSARDGIDIPAYLSTPVDYEEGEKRPAIVMPHGGPYARDYQGWDTWVQFLTNRGYIVLQPNFRGSTGFGGRFTALGYGEWGGDMQQDVADAAKWLVRNGYTRKDTICVVGGSYGGYAALMGIVSDPDKFKCAVAWAPVTDLKLILEQDDAYTKKSSWYWRVTGGKTKKELRKISPRFQVKKINQPLLLMHGVEDDIVYIEQSRLLVKALKKNKKENFKYIEIPGLGHSPETPASQRQFLEALESFLTEHNPTASLRAKIN